MPVDASAAGPSAAITGQKKVVLHNNMAVVDVMTGAERGSASGSVKSTVRAGAVGLAFSGDGVRRG